MNAKATNGFTSQNELRDLMGEPMDLAARKSVSKLDKYSKEYISRSPFLCIGSADETGKADVSPRGDPPGFVQVLDDNTLFIPDRPGNRPSESPRPKGGASNCQDQIDQAAEDLLSPHDDIGYTS